MGLFKKLKDGFKDMFSPNKPYYTNEGYKQVCRPGTPSARKNGYAPEHRYNYESKYGRIPDGYVIHHKNGNKHDNRVRNLQAMPKKEHDKHHHYFWYHND